MGFFYKNIHINTMTHEQFKNTKQIILKEIEEWKGPKVSYDFILGWISEHVSNSIWSDKKSSRKYTPSMTSYGLKHVIELNGKCNWSDYQGYCANNWVKLALIELGFDICYEMDDTKDWCEDYQKWITEPKYVLDNSVNYIFRKISK